MFLVVWGCLAVGLRSCHRDLSSLLLAPENVSDKTTSTRFSTTYHGMVFVVAYVSMPVFFYLKHPTSVDHVGVCKAPATPDLACRHKQRHPESVGRGRCSKQARFTLCLELWLFQSALYHIHILSGLQHVRRPLRSIQPAAELSKAHSDRPHTTARPARISGVAPPGNHSVAHEYSLS